MPIGTILIIILVIALLGGFSGRVGGYGFGYGHGGDSSALFSLSLLRLFFWDAFEL